MRDQVQMELFFFKDWSIPHRLKQSEIWVKICVDDFSKISATLKYVQMELRLSMWAKYVHSLRNRPLGWSLIKNIINKFLQEPSKVHI